MSELRLVAGLFNPQGGIFRHGFTWLQKVSPDAVLAAEKMRTNKPPAKINESLPPPKKKWNWKISRKVEGNHHLWEGAFVFWLKGDSSLTFCCNQTNKSRWIAHGEQRISHSIASTHEACFCTNTFALCHHHLIHTWCLNTACSDPILTKRAWLHFGQLLLGFP